ncbi:hypothetical protein ACSS6W_001489 [Trichoderma asperelloides]|uniref:F-box domain-containing protein n=1 Tax=Trichoderma asperellum TaxID=101201 RepID=A0A6V8QMX8_TRIAP|nr:hypothetical protein TASIC1_0003023900 [Trichoderma asperellum]
MDIVLANLPYHIFSDIVFHLPPTGVISFQRVSRLMHEALTRDELCITLIWRHFPRSREGRRLRQLLRDGDRVSLDRGNWAAVFARLARRYYYLGRAMPWATIKVPVMKDAALLRGVAPWNRFLSLNSMKTIFDYEDTVWTVAPTEGLLVYPAPETASSEPGYRARDLATGVEFRVPFKLKGRIVRRVRLSHGILAIEWCPKVGCVPFGGIVPFHRHYAILYDVRRAGSWDGVIPQRPTAGVATPGYSWKFDLRSEFEIHHTGLPVNSTDRFFSTHNATHYAVYVWQTTRYPSSTPSNIVGPIERLTIWEIRTPSPYRPSLDKLGIARRDPTVGPRVIRRMANSQLAAWSVLQGVTPSLRSLALDDCTWNASRYSACGHVFFTEEEHKWSAGPHSSLDPPRFHLVKTTGIPLIGNGPRWVDECRGGSDANIQPFRRSRWRRHATETYEEEEDDDDYDDNGSGDGDNDGTTSANTTAAPSAPSFLKTIPWARHSETWPGRAPCWRHVDFPYMTMSEVLDMPAGIRIIARNCFMLATLSVFPRPKIHIEGVDEDGPITRKKKAKRGKKRRFRSSSSGPSSSSSDSSILHENGPLATLRQCQDESEDRMAVQFAVGIWAQVMCKGCIYGDERWLIGEDTDGDVTILMF